MILLGLGIFLSVYFFKIKEDWKNKELVTKKNKKSTTKKDPSKVINVPKEIINPISTTSSSQTKNEETPVVNVEPEGSEKQVQQPGQDLTQVQGKEQADENGQVDGIKTEFEEDECNTKTFETVENKLEIHIPDWFDSRPQTWNDRTFLSTNEIKRLFVNWINKDVRHKQFFKSKVYEETDEYIGYIYKNVWLRQWKDGSQHRFWTDKNYWKPWSTEYMITPKLRFKHGYEQPDFYVPRFFYDDDSQDYNHLILLLKNWLNLHGNRAKEFIKSKKLKETDEYIDYVYKRIWIRHYKLGKEIGDWIWYSNSWSNKIPRNLWSKHGYDLNGRVIENNNRNENIDNLKTLPLWNCINIEVNPIEVDIPNWFDDDTLNVNEVKQRFFEWIDENEENKEFIKSKAFEETNDYIDYIYKRIWIRHYKLGKEPNNNKLFWYGNWSSYLKTNKQRQLAGYIENDQ